MMVMVMTIKITIVFSWSGEDDENSDEVLMTLTKFLPRYILVTRSVCTLILTILPIATSLALYIDDRFDIFDKTLCQRKPSIRPSLTRHGEAGLLSGAVQSLSWALHLMYTFLLHHRWHKPYISTLTLNNLTWQPPSGWAYQCGALVLPSLPGLPRSLPISSRWSFFGSGWKRDKRVKWKCIVLHDEQGMWEADLPHCWDLSPQVRSQLLASYEMNNRAEEVVFASAATSAVCLTAYLLSLLPGNKGKSCLDKKDSCHLSGGDSFCKWSGKSNKDIREEVLDIQPVQHFHSLPDHNPLL